MAAHEQTLTSAAEYPYYDDRIPVTEGAEGFAQFIEAHPGYTFIPYLAHKTPEGWDKSVSRYSMNKGALPPNCLYVPVNIPGGDKQALDAFFAFIENRADVPLLNATEPHKLEIRDRYLGGAASGQYADTIVRDPADGKLKPRDMNSGSFARWYRDEFGSVQGRPVIMVGAGGVGEPLAKLLAPEAASMTIVDVSDKSIFTENLALTSGRDIAYTNAPQELFEQGLKPGTVFINAAGAKGADDPAVQMAIAKGAEGGICIDLRPQAEVDTIQEALRYGSWEHALTGEGMFLYNGLAIAEAVAELYGTTAPTLEQFKQMAAAVPQHV